MLESWPRVLTYATSFLFIANSWVGNDMQYHLVRRFQTLRRRPDVAGARAAVVRGLPALPDLGGGGARLGPRGPAVLPGQLPRDLPGDVGDVVVLELGSPSRRSGAQAKGHPAPAPHLLGGTGFVRRADGPGGREGGPLVNPLLLAYLLAFGGVVLGVVEGREPPLAEAEEPEASDDAGPQEDEDEAKGPAKRADSRTPEKACSTRSSE